MELAVVKSIYLPEIDPALLKEIGTTTEVGDHSLRTESGLFAGTLGVSDGTRTRDRLDHNQELYQLSYAHHACRPVSRRLSEASSGPGATRPP